MNSQPTSFLVADDEEDARYLLTKSLSRRFPGCRFHECEDADQAIAIIRTVPLDAVVVHRCRGIGAAGLIESIRKYFPTIPIVWVSGADRSAEAVRLGANAFVPYAGWLTLGDVVAEEITKVQSGLLPAGDLRRGDL